MQVGGFLLLITKRFDDRRHIFIAQTVCDGGFEEAARDGGCLELDIVTSCFVLGIKEVFGHEVEQKVDVEVSANHAR